jgi:hypothetical protein
MRQVATACVVAQAVLGLALAGCGGEEDGRGGRPAARVAAGPDAGPARSKAGVARDAQPDAADASGGGAAGAKTYPLHAVALFHLVNVYAEPDARSLRVGVLRRGARVRVGTPVDGPGCGEGRWHPVTPRGYVCSGKTLRVGEQPPPIAFEPIPPRLDAPTPYDYGRNYQEGIPLYRRPPTTGEMAREREYQKTLSEEAAAAAAAAADAAAATAAAEAVPIPGPGPEEQEEEEEEDEDAVDPRSLTGPIAARLKRGFYVTVEKIILAQGLRWVRTSELNYVNAEAIRRRQVDPIEGTQLGADLTLPIVITYRDAKSRRMDDRGRVKAWRDVPAFKALPLLGTVRVNGEDLYSVGDGELIAADRVRRIEPADPPPEVRPGEQWIDVSLSEQTLVAYEGARPVYATVVSTGKQGHETPTGAFTITSKYVSTNMADAPEGDEPYLIEDVPWTMYFNLAIALHGAFWHSRFGEERSHGCVNLAPADARWLFFWVHPVLPEGWHGVSATDDNPGARVYVRR